VNHRHDVAVPIVRTIRRLPLREAYNRKIRPRSGQQEAIMRPLERKHLRIFRVIITGSLLACAPLSGASAKPAGQHPPQLEQAIGQASLILVGRVAAVSEQTYALGGKSYRITRSYDFEPVSALKGLYARDVLSLTSVDLGDPTWAPVVGVLRLILLVRSNVGYFNINRQRTPEESLPVIASVDDPLVRSVELLIGITQEPDRARKVERLVAGLATVEGPAAIPLLESLAFRWLLAAQHPDVASITRLLSDGAPEVRTATARTLGVILEADYLENGTLADRIVMALSDFLRTSEPNVAARVAALDALGAARAGRVATLAAEQLQPTLERATWAEQGAVIRAIGQQQLDGFADEIRALAEALRLDAPATFEGAVLSALARLDAGASAPLLAERIEDKHAAGLEAIHEIEAAGGLPLEDAVAVLMSVAPERMSRRERSAFAAASRVVADARLVPALAALLDPRTQDVHSRATEALLEIDTPEAAGGLRPYLAQESVIARKLEIAAFLARHGIDAGAPYALEHMSEAGLLESAIAVFEALASLEPVAALRQIANTSNDTLWTGAAIRALAALQDQSLVPQLLAIAEDFRHPLMPYALVALGELGEPQAVEIFREGIGSRDDRIVAASVRGAAALFARGEVDDAALRDEIAALLGSADAALGVRTAALDALVELGDPRLDTALAAAVFDGRLETTGLLDRVETLLEEQTVALARLLDGDLVSPATLATR
jgi:HEAT repeat protein